MSWRKLGLSVIHAASTCCLLMYGMLQVCTLGEHALLPLSSEFEQTACTDDSLSLSWITHYHHNYDYSVSELKQTACTNDHSLLPDPTQPKKIHDTCGSVNDTNKVCHALRCVGSSAATIKKNILRVVCTGISVVGLR